MGHGEIKDTKTRLSLVIPKALKAELDELAKQDGRTLSNLIVKVLTEYTRSIKKTE